MDKELIYLDTYVLQQDLRIRLPKSILTNLSLEKGKSMLNIYFDKDSSCLILKPAEVKHGSEKENK